MNKSIYFLSGLPRSGSTLLGSLLGQNSNITVTPTSPLLDLMCYTNEAFQKLNNSYTFDYQKTSDAIYKGIIDNFYNLFSTPIIIDKHRGWPRNLLPVKQYITDDPRIICTYRPISEIITSYIVLINKNKDKTNFVDDHLNKLRLSITTENRAKILWENYISDPYQSTIYGIKNCKNNILFVSYDEINKEPKIILDKIYEFLNIKNFKDHYFENMKNYCGEEKDAAWGIEGLHDIRKNLGKQSVNPNQILGNYLTDYYNQFNLNFT